MFFFDPCSIGRVGYKSITNTGKLQASSCHQYSESQVQGDVKVLLLFFVYFLFQELQFPSIPTPGPPYWFDAHCYYKSMPDVARPPKPCPPKEPPMPPPCQPPPPPPCEPNPCEPIKRPY